MFAHRKKSSQSEKSHFFALRDEKNRVVCLISKKGAK
ncbi:MAG: hypothetical protein QG629_542 [Patescibacteria group bacterium]|nr:hypothetical protein [Patescibacteria group bacterium]